MDKIRIPETVSDMTMKHLPFILALQKMDADKRTVEDLPYRELTEMISSFTGEPVAYIAQFQKTSIYNLFAEICLSCSKREEYTLPASIECDGKHYDFVVDFTKMPIAWHIDCDDVDVEKNPIDLVAVCYIERGMTYGQIDKNKNVINPIAARREIFKKHVSLPLFLAVQGFFLENWSVLRFLQGGKRKKVSESKGKSTHSSGKSQ